MKKFCVDFHEVFNHMLIATGGRTKKILGDLALKMLLWQHCIINTSIIELRFPTKYSSMAALNYAGRFSIRYGSKS